MTERVVFHETVRFANFSALLPAHLSAKASRMPRMTPQAHPDASFHSGRQRSE